MPTRRLEETRLQRVARGNRQTIIDWNKIHEKKSCCIYPINIWWHYDTQPFKCISTRSWQILMLGRDCWEQWRCQLPESKLSRIFNHPERSSCWTAVFPSFWLFVVGSGDNEMEKDQRIPAPILKILPRHRMRNVTHSERLERLERDSSINRILKNPNPPAENLEDGTKDPEKSPIPSITSIVICVCVCVCVCVCSSWEEKNPAEFHRFLKLP